MGASRSPSDRSWARCAPPLNWVVRTGNAYVEIFRNIPLLVQMFLWFFVLPELLPEQLGNAIKQIPAAVGRSIPRPSRSASTPRLASPSRCAPASSRCPGQSMAALALGLTLPQTYRYVLLPMAFASSCRR